MGYSSSVYKAAADRLSDRRVKALREAEYRKNSIYKELPRVKELEKEISRSGIMAARAVLSGGNVTEQMEKLRDFQMILCSW